MEWPKLKKNKLAELVVEFQPISSTGVLFFMEFILSDRNLISMLSYQNSSLQLSVKKSLKKEVVTNFVNSTVVSYNSTNILSLRVIRNELQIKLNNGTWHPYTLQPRSHVIRVKDLLIGGARICPQLLCWFIGWHQCLIKLSKFDGNGKNTSYGTEPLYACYSFICEIQHLQYSTNICFSRPN